MSNKSKLISAMSGIEPYEPQDDDSIFSYKNVSTGNYDPPAYIVAFVFFFVLGYKNFGAFEKVWWHTYFRYKNIPFLIRDYKFGTWSLEAKTDIEVAKKLVPELKGKIRSAARHADNILKAEFKAEIEKGQFYINNGYGKLRSTYEFYLEETKAAVAALDEFVVQEALKKHNMQEIADSHNRRIHLETLVTYRTIPLINTFFSLLEFLLDVFYAFQQPELSFFEYRNLSWQDRFKRTIPLQPGSDFTKNYERLVNIRSQYRNPFTHGLTNESSLLVPFSFAGLVPVSYEHLSNTVHYGLVQMSSNTVKEIITILSDFLDLIANEEPYCYYLLYLDYGFPVPIARQAVESIIKEMTDYEGFEQYLQGRSRYEDAVINRDI
jgi:hypothetical protein